MAINPYETGREKFHLRAQATRRQFLVIMGAVAALGSVVLAGLQSLKFLFPAATLESPAEFKIDEDPSTIELGRVLQITDKRVAVVRDDGGFYAVYLICTHLGCTPNYVSNVTAGSGVADSVAAQRGERKGAGEAIPNGWACPCHGSRYFIDSTNFYGPAPRPMDWVFIGFAPDGKLLVNRGKLVAQRQAGDTTAPEWRLDPVTKRDNGKTLGV